MAGELQRRQAELVHATRERLTELARGRQGCQVEVMLRADSLRDPEPVERSKPIKMPDSGGEPGESLAGRPAGEAIQQLVEGSGDKIFGLGLKLCGNRQEAEDLVQETFLQAFRKWEQYEGRSQPTSWLYTIAARICQRRHRRRSGEPSRLESLEELLPKAETTVVDLPSGQGGPFDERLRREAAEVVDRALGKLPLEFRLPLVLKEIAELSVREISEILGIKEATVKTRVHRGRLALRRELEAALPRRSAPHTDHPRQVCLSLLRSKLDALDRGVDFPVASEELCARCEALFDSLDLTMDACRWVEGGELPGSLRTKLARELSHGLPRL